MEPHIAALREGFTRAFRRSPSFVVRAPGRVNLIGEHTDYNGYPVLPMALTRAITIVLAPRDDRTVVIRSPLPEFGERSFEVGEAINPAPTGDWSNYVRAASQGLVGHFGVGPTWRGFDAFVAGDVPRGAGLSSSSALVVASALALLVANGRDVPPAELADLMAEAEHYVGTAGGGMDQAVCLQARPRHALRVDFFPLRSEPLPLPGSVSVVVANSLVKAEKTGSALLKYNRRPIECRLATSIIASAIESSLGDWLPGAQRLADLEAPERGVSRSDLLAFAEGALANRPYTKEHVARSLSIDIPSLERAFFSLSDGQVFPELEDGFRLRQRVRHVLSEATRVDRATDALRRSDVIALGKLMDESHASCRDDYEISTPQLDVLVGIMRKAGALGARLTGAGFGGCAVALVERDEAPGFLEAVRRAYYVEYLGLGETLPAGLGQWEDIVFATEAGGGALVEELEG